MSSSLQTSSSQEIEIPSGEPLHVPCAEVLLDAAKEALQDDKPIKLDYYEDSVNCNCDLGRMPGYDEVVLYKNSEENTSVVKRIVRVSSKDNSQTDIMCVTENSIYIVSDKLLQKKMQQKAQAAAAKNG